jgi:hypothetical protein
MLSPHRVVHFPDLQLLASPQSLLTLHEAPSLHTGHVPPPQSTSVSAPFRT